jgi:hypothetical protein
VGSLRPSQNATWSAKELPLAIPIPKLAPILVIAGDARLAALVSCALARPGYYLGVVDGPRLARADRDSEVIRRNNAAARVKAAGIVLAGLPDDEFTAMSQALPIRRTLEIKTEAGAKALMTPEGAGDPPLRWGRDRLGVGLLLALRAQRTMVFDDEIAPADDAPSLSGHLVVCEAEDDLVQVVAANYAFALGAGLVIIPKVEDQDAEALLERLYGLYEYRDTAPADIITEVTDRLRGMCGDLQFPEGASLTFISRRLPYGFAHPEVPSTHLFAYPDLGIAIINGFAAEQPGTPGVNVALMIDPAEVHAAEIEPTAKALSGRGLFVSARHGAAADVTTVEHAVSMYPYDLLLFATHCGDAPGYRWTYEFRDSEGLDRRLVVDVAVGVGRTDDPERLAVMQHSRFRELDGVAWDDPEKAEKLYVGRAILDWLDRTGHEEPLAPVEKADIGRVAGSAALKMHDHLYLPHPTSLAGQGTPLILNNACSSWHELASRFTFAGARGYIGTLFEVTSAEAYEIAVCLLGEEFGRALPLALWKAQARVYGTGTRRPYIMTGVYPQRLRAKRQDTPAIITARLEQGLAYWRRELARSRSESNERLGRRAKAAIAFHREEIDRLRRHWGAKATSKPDTIL